MRIHVFLAALERTRVQLHSDRIPLYSLGSYPLYSRGALNALVYDTVLPA